MSELVSKSEPLVSVIIPVYNGAKFLPAAVDSVLAQSYRNFEIVVVDDGSEDDTPAVAAELADKIRYFREPHRGVAATRNRGLEEAQGSLIAFLDVDDTWPVYKLERQAQRLAEDPSLDFVLGLLQRTWHNSEGHLMGGPEELALNNGTALFRRETFEKMGRFDESQAFCEDLDWFMRAREIGLNFRIQRAVMLRYYRHDGNMTNQVAVNNQAFIQALKKSLIRRRLAGLGPLPEMSSYYDD
jgi:glycosyltransferase involved in cell wall biosynthesis